MSKRAVHLRVLDTANKRYHDYTVCGRVDVWGPTWQWYGSVLDLDEGRPIVKVCSDKCRSTWEKTGRTDDAA